MERDFKGVWIPKEIWLDERLNALDKIILVEINSLDGEEGCYASNKYLAEFCQCSEAKVSKSISLLIKLGYIEVAYFDGRKRFLKTCLIKNESLIKNTTQPSKIYKADLENLQDNNIDNNIDNNSNNNKLLLEAEPKQYGNEDINRLFDEWEKFCGFKIDTKIKANRYACNRLLKSRGLESVLKALPYVAEAQQDKYAPCISNFMDLADKWNNLALWYKRKMNSDFMKYGKIVIGTNERK